MNFALAKEVYGVPWCVDAISFQSLTAILENNRNGVELELPEIKYNSISFYNVKSKTELIYSEYQLDNSNDFEGIGIINLNGPITVSGGASSYGMEELSNRMLSMAKDPRVKAFVMPTNSGGGATGGVDIMASAIRKVKASKPVYGLVKKGGMAGSAAYGILASTTKIYSESGMNIVGSSGTMIQFEGRPANTTDENGVKHIRLYASKSIAKNKPFEEAINKDNYELIINEILDPVNEHFLSGIISDRPQLEGSNYDDGRTVFSKDAVGTYIDGIASFEEVISMALADSSSESNSNNNNSNSNKMTKDELKSQHPTVYAEILSEGVSNEQERVASWMAFNEADPKAVSEGIASGKEIAPSQTYGFLVALANKGRITDLKNDNAPHIVSKETPTEPVAEKTAAQLELEAASDFTIKI